MRIPFFGHKFIFEWFFKWERPQRDPYSLETIVQDVLPESKNELINELRKRIMNAADSGNPTTSEDRLASALGAAVYSRWEFEFYRKQWPREGIATRDIICEALGKADALLVRLVAALQALKSDHLKKFVLPAGVPALEFEEALGPVRNEVRVAVVAGR